MRKFIYWLIVFVVGLLVGFVPQYLKVHRLAAELNACTAGMELARVQQSAALTYISATQLNYGVASGYAQKFFGEAQKLAGSTSDPALRNSLAAIQSPRDKITSDLAKGNSEVVNELQPVVWMLLQAGQ